ncbi:protein OSB1, mitochondrial-like [Aristolochia californica]|uniref:protein OSB1, mitochondrial-like n=1 Tax=Aristolochia californica TaxID=171875 RepID=UPI0035D6C343
MSCFTRGFGCNHHFFILGMCCTFSLHKFSIPFTVSSASSSARCAYSSFYATDLDGGSTAYRRSLQSRRPPTIRFERRLVNSVGLIGSVVREVKICNNKYGGFGVHTMLELKSPRESGTALRIILLMSDDLAKISLRYLKPNDFIHVSGQLSCYEKISDIGKPELLYKVIVSEWNYVSHKDKYQTSHESECLRQNKEMKTAKESSDENVETVLDSSTAEDNRTNRLLLWQIFFANPQEWWDNRKCKNSSKSPDFKHKDTKESLWISSSDPPWVKLQLQRLDDRMAGSGHQANGGRWSGLSLGKFNL